MMLAAILAAVLVTSTVPFHKQGDSGCSSWGPVIADMDSGMTWYQVSGTKTPILADAVSLRGKEGMAWDTNVPTTSVATVWRVTKRIGGSWSCPSNFIGINLTVSVPPTRLRLPEMWFDVLGRPMQKAPTTPGFYLHRRADGTVGKDAVTR